MLPASQVLSGLLSCIEQICRQSMIICCTTSLCCLPHVNAYGSLPAAMCCIDNSAVHNFMDKKIYSDAAP